jgi:hypothetical protein
VSNSKSIKNLADMETKIGEKNRKREIDVNKKERSHRGSHSIYLPIDKAEYEILIEDAVLYRKFISKSVYYYKELFPKGIEEGFTLADKDTSKKLGLKIRRIELKCSGVRYSIYPSYVLPYMVSEITREIENGMLLLHYGTPYWLVSRVLGKNDSYWERIEQSIGRKSIVGTSTYNTKALPKDYVADEKISFWHNQEVYIAMTSSQECVLGLSVSKTADEAGLSEAYGVFKKEAQELQADFSPTSVNTDAWASTRKAWRVLFSKVTLLLCFLHSVLKIRGLMTQKYEYAQTIVSRLWEAYHQEKEVDFCDTLFDLQKYVKNDLKNDKIGKALDKIVQKIGDYAGAYKLTNPYRTSNMVDRQMKQLDRLLFKRQYFHGHLQTLENKIRAWALIHNFHPFVPRTQRYKSEFQLSRVQQLNGFVYHKNWLKNLIIAGSLNGSRFNPTIR